MSGWIQLQYNNRVPVSHYLYGTQVFPVSSSEEERFFGDRLTLHGSGKLNSWDRLKCTFATFRSALARFGYMPEVLAITASDNWYSFLFNELVFFGSIDRLERFHLLLLFPCHFGWENHF